MSSIGSLEEEYLRLEPLQTRIMTHREYSEVSHDIELDVINAARIGANDDVLDVGCGTASFLARLKAGGHPARLVALDTSPAAVAAAEAEGVTARLGDAQALPFADDQFDVVAARHMLYHVDDPMAAIAEARRVLRPGGRLVATVNHQQSTPRIAELVREQVVRHGITPPVLPMSRVHSGNLPGMIEEVFGAVTVQSMDNALLFDEPAPVARYGLALLNFYGVGADSPLRQVIAKDVVAAVDRRFADGGAPWRDPKGYVVCVATRDADRVG